MILVYYLHYILVFFLSGLSVFRRNTNRVTLPVLGILLTAFAAFRAPGLDRDYFVYTKFFQAFIGENVEYFTLDKATFYEPSFYVIPTISEALAGSNYLYLSFAVFACLGVYFKLKSFELSNSIFLSAILYVSYFYLIHEMTQIRVGVATGILLLAVKPALERKFPVFLLHIIGACFFHYSSILFLAIYFFNPQKINRILTFSVIIVAYLIALFGVDVIRLTGLYYISPKIAVYSETVKLKEAGNAINIFNFWFFIDVIITSFLIYRWQSVLQQNKYFPILVKINVTGIVCYLLLSSLAIVAGRIYELFSVVQIVLYPSLIFAFRKKILGYLSCILISVLHFVYLFYIIQLFDKDYHTWLF